MSIYSIYRAASSSDKSDQNGEVLFDSASLPYYVLNTNDDLIMMQEVSNVAMSCFPNDIQSVCKHYDMQAEDIQLLENSKLFGENGAVRVLMCPDRSDLYSYMNWYMMSIDKVINELRDSKSIVEIPLFPVKYVYEQLFSKLKEGSYRIYKSVYFVPYIDCLYMQRVNGVKESASDSITNYKMFSAKFQNEFHSYLEYYLVVMAKVAAYIKRGNYYGNEMTKYKTDKTEFIQNLGLKK